MGASPVSPTGSPLAGRKNGLYHLSLFLILSPVSFEGGRVYENAGRGGQPAFHKYDENFKMDEIRY